MNNKAFQAWIRLINVCNNTKLYNKEDTTAPIQKFEKLYIQYCIVGLFKKITKINTLKYIFRKNLFCKKIYNALEK